MRKVSIRRIEKFRTGAFFMEKEDLNMDRYTIETLSCINDDYIIANHEIRQRDVDMVNAYIELIES